jgi:hypothetical protein
MVDTDFEGPAVQGFEHTLEYINTLGTYKLWIIISLFSDTFGYSSKYVQVLSRKK